MIKWFCYAFEYGHVKGKCFASAKTLSPSLLSLNGPKMRSSNGVQRFSDAVLRYCVLFYALEHFLVVTNRVNRP